MVTPVAYRGRVRIIAHRGASQQFAEHTRGAYLQAIAEGADGLECDVQLTADRQMVLWHDATLDRTSEGTGLVHEHTMAQIRSLDTVTWRSRARRKTPWRRSFWRNRGWRNWLPASSYIPPEFGTVAEQALTLNELIDIARASGRAMDLMVEFKYPSPFGNALEDAVLGHLADLGWDPVTARLDNLTIYFMSFSPASMRYLLGKAPSAHLMFLLDVFTKPDVAADGLALVDEGIIGGVGPGMRYVQANQDQVRAWAEAGRTVRVWTVNTAQNARDCLELGADEFTTNLPARLRAGLATPLT